MQVLLVVQVECAALTKDSIARHIRIFILQIWTVTQQLQLETKNKKTINCLVHTSWIK